MARQPGQEPGAAAPQYSPDRRWWWNGREWQPVSQPVSQPPVSNQRIRPGRWPYFVAVVVIALGTTALLIALPRLLTFPSAIANAIRIMAPGKTEIPLAEAGTYMISYERGTSGNIGGWSLEASNEKPNLPSEISSMQLDLVPTASTTRVSTYPPSGGYNYLVQNREGVVIAVFNVDRPGAYSLAARYANGESQPQIALAIVQGSPEDLFVSRPLFDVLGVVVGLGLLFVGLGIGGVTLFSQDPHQGPSEANGNPRAQAVINRIC